MTSEGSRESLGDVVGRVVQQVQGLIRGEVELAKAQAKEKVAAIGIGGAMFGAAGFLAFIAFLLLITTAVLALALVMPAWLAALIMALVFLLIAGILALLGKRALAASSAVKIDPKAGLGQTADAIKAGIAASSTTHSDGDRIPVQEDTK